MLENVVYERKNLLYEELLEHVIAQRSLVTCCIDAHFTAFQVLDNNCCVYYDPLKPRLTLVYGDQSMRKFICYLLLKCSYADNSHVQENKGHYMGPDATPIRRGDHGGALVCEACGLHELGREGLGRVDPQRRSSRPRPAIPRP